MFYIMLYIVVFLSSDATVMGIVSLLFTLLTFGLYIQLTMAASKSQANKVTQFARLIDTATGTVNITSLHYKYIHHRRLEIDYRNRISFSIEHFMYL